MEFRTFTAEASLYKSARLYRGYSSGTRLDTAPPATVVPTYKVPPNVECYETCGECSVRCEKTCQNTCHPTPEVKSCCDSTETCCNGNCVNTASDSANCGACGNVCPTGKICSHGVCGCPSGLKQCDGKCVDLSSDPLNCGACGVTCPTGLCCGGTCGGTICSDGGCCPKGQPCCKNPIGMPVGMYCCSHQCIPTPFGNVCI